MLFRSARQEANRRSVTVDWRCADLAGCVLPEAHYDLIVNIHFVNRDLVAQFADALKPGGWLVFEQHLRWPRPVGGPASPHYRLRPGELRQLLWQLEVVHYEEGLFPGIEARSQLALARAVAQKNP